MTRTLVDGYGGRGAYSRNIINTEADMAQLARPTALLAHCEQFIKYDCHHSVLLYNCDPLGVT